MGYYYKIGIRKDARCYLAIVPALPGCISHGATKEEAVSNAEAAIRAYVKAIKKKKEKVPAEDDPPHTFLLPPSAKQEKETAPHIEHKLPQVTGREMVSILRKDFGFTVVSHEGSHAILEKMAKEGRIRLSVPEHDYDLGKGLIRAILDEAHVDRLDFYLAVNPHDRQLKRLAATLRREQEGASATA